MKRVYLVEVNENELDIGEYVYFKGYRFWLTRTQCGDKYRLDRRDVNNYEEIMLTKDEYGRIASYLKVKEILDVESWKEYKRLKLMEQPEKYNLQKGLAKKKFKKVKRVTTPTCKWYFPSEQ